MSDISINLFLLPLLQLSDSNFPTGAFSHSFGLETYIQEQQVYDRPTFAKWLRIYIREQMVYTDGLACKLTYEMLDGNQLESVWALDRKITVQSAARETREGNRRMGERMVRLGAELYPVQALLEYRDRIVSKRSEGHPAIAFAIIAHHLQMPKSTAVLSYLYSCMSSLIQNGVRAIPLGQTDGQLLLQQIGPWLEQGLQTIEELDEDDFGIVSPGLEMAQMRHERLHFRLFMS